MTGVSWKLSMQSFLASSRTPPQITVTRKCCFTTSRRVSSPDARKFSIRGSTAFVRGTDAETKHLREKASLLQDFPSRVPTKRQMLSPMIHRLARIKAVKIAVIRKLISLRNRCTYPQQSTRKEETLKFVKSWYFL